MANRTADKNRWIKEKLDRVNLTVPKGQKELIRDHAQAHGESVSGFINRAIREAMDRDQEKVDRNQHIAQIAAENGRSTDAVEHDMEIEAALAILEQEIPSIRKFYGDEKQKESIPDNTGTRLINLDEHN